MAKVTQLVLETGNESGKSLPRAQACQSPLSAFEDVQLVVEAFAIIPVWSRMDSSLRFS